jgi:hypothetical protein
MVSQENFSNVRGESDKKKGGNLVAWDVAQKPKEKGGLGVINLRLQNNALLLKQLHKFYNKEDIPWVNLIWFKYYQHVVPHTAREKGSFWRKDIWRLNVIYRSVSHCIIGDGTSVCFWEDKWRPEILSARYQRLASFARKRQASVQEVSVVENLDELFILPLSQQAHDEFVDLSNEILEVNLDVLSADCWLPSWGSLFTPKRFYSIYSTLEGHPIFRKTWKSSCTPRVKFFAWLVLIDRLNTKTILTRRNIGDREDDLCVMCDARIDETVDHLFFSYSFVRGYWNKLSVTWDYNLDIPDRILKAIENGLVFYLEAILIAAWELWKARNDLIFQRHPPTVDRWFGNFRNQCYLKAARFSTDLRATFCFWLDAFS